MKDRTRLSRITKHARMIIPDVNTMDNIYESMVIKKVNNIIRLDDELSRYYITMRSGSRYYRAPGEALVLFTGEGGGGPLVKTVKTYPNSADKPP